MNARDEFDKSAISASARIGGHPSTRTLVAATLLVAGLHLAVGSAAAQVPSVGHIAVCNQEAREGLRGRTAFPTQKDEAGAHHARNARPGTGQRPDVTGHVTRSPDPQIAGMDAEGAKDAAYRAAYRVCMRKTGF